jgi:hypothetical protein
VLKVFACIVLHSGVVHGARKPWVLLLLQRSLLPGGIILQGVSPPRFYERFCVPLRLGAN